MKKKQIIIWIFILPFIANAQNPIQIKGVFPQMAVVSDHNWRTEAGIEDQSLGQINLGPISNEWLRSKNRTYYQS